MLRQREAAGHWQTTTDNWQQLTTKTTVNYNQLEQLFIFIFIFFCFSSSEKNGLQAGGYPLCSPTVGCFQKAGGTITQQRMRVSTEFVQHLCMLHDFCKKINYFETTWWVLEGGFFTYPFQLPSNAGIPPSIFWNWLCTWHCSSW